MNRKGMVIFMYRQEHPNPQFFRNEWINLNGEWDFDFDFGCSGIERKFYEKDGFDKKINVPFCPESKLSGIEYKDFMNGVWYMRSFDIPENWKDGKVFIHFGAVDYKAVVYINKKKVGEHEGGYISFKLDITDFVTEGKNTVTVYAEDDNRHGKQPKGKQADKFYSSVCDYTRTTGIWQTVWLEHTPASYIERFEFYPDVENCKLSFKVITSGCGNLTVKTSYEGKPMGETALECGGVAFGEIALAEKHLWEVGCGRLYDVELCFGDDKVITYFGLRTAKMEGMKFLLNGKSVFQRLVLDQGFYPDGIYTAPTADDLEKDILLSLDAGFNGARLHEKIFEPLFLYYCDKHGYLAWGEFPNWGIDHTDCKCIPAIFNEWREELERDFNHPSIIGWCPFNETWDYNGRQQDNSVISTIYYFTKSFDQTRPCIDTSGNYHVVTDIFDVHDYEQNVEKFASHFDLANGKFENHCNHRQTYNGEPMFVSEYGGICRNFDNTEGWGYGDAPKTEEEFIERYRGLTTTLIDDPYMFGFCYTQLYDIEQEINGLYTYKRVPKFDMKIIKEINTKKAAIED